MQTRLSSSPPRDGLASVCSPGFSLSGAPAPEEMTGRLKPGLQTGTAPTRASHRLAHLLERARQTRVLENRGRVVQLIGLVIESAGPLAAVGDVCRIESARHDGWTLAEVVGFRNHHVLLMPLGAVHGIHPGSEVIALGGRSRWGWETS